MDEAPFKSDGGDVFSRRRGLEVRLRLLEPHISQQRHRRRAAEAAEAFEQCTRARAGGFGQMGDGDRPLRVSADQFLRAPDVTGRRRARLPRQRGSVVAGLDRKQRRHQRLLDIGDAARFHVSLEI